MDNTELINEVKEIKEILKNQRNYIFPKYSAKELLIIFGSFGTSFGSIFKLITGLLTKGGYL